MVSLSLLMLVLLVIVQGCMVAAKCVPSQATSDAFKEFTGPRDKGITKRNLKKFFTDVRKHKVTDAQAKAMVQVYDLNGDGVIDLEEFCEMLAPPPTNEELKKIFKEIAHGKNVITIADFKRLLGEGKVSYADLTHFPNGEITLDEFIRLQRSIEENIRAQGFV